ncbi:MAG: HAMP domain-containing sensor histidine kinase [Candidatus Aminicenantes bacterium]|jgi:signal transduction histidine kinase
MTPLRIWKRPSKYNAVLFLAVAAVSVIALVWMGVRLLQQDRALEAQRLEEKREAAADRIIVALEKTLSEEEQKLTAEPKDEFLQMADDHLLAIMDSREIRVYPDKALLYYPIIPAGREAASSQFASAERAEFQEKNYTRAINVLHLLSRSKDPATRIGAQFRLARNQKKAGRIEAALNTYDEISRSTDLGISVSGVPSDLVARRARCVLLEELEKPEQLQKEAQDLLDDLKGRRWHLDRASYLYYTDQVTQWLGEDPRSDPDEQALADAVLWLWQNRQTFQNNEVTSIGRKSFIFHKTAVISLWKVPNDRLIAVVAGPNYQRSQLFDPLFKGSDFSGIGVRISDPDGVFIYGYDQTDDVPSTARLTSVTGLPWNITIVNANIDAELSQFSQRRRLMMMGLGILALLVIAASYFIGRAVSRELAAARLQSDFVSAVSHEFRTPLTSMRQFTEMLVENENLPKDKRHTYYQAQERSTRRLSRLVESLLDFGRMEAGARPYCLEPLDAGQLVKSVIEEFEQESDSNDLIIDCSVPNSDIKIKGDREALTQALWNLLDNALKYSGDNPTIHVGVETGDEVAIHVRDQGFGIPYSERKRILQKFIRGSSAKKCGIKGTGIGLAIVKHIVDAHNGKVLIDSEPGKGSTFTIQLPAGGSLNDKDSDR